MDSALLQVSAAVERASCGVHSETDNALLQVSAAVERVSCGVHSEMDNASKQKVRIIILY